MAETIKYIKYVQLDPEHPEQKLQVKDIEAADTPIPDSVLASLFDRQPANTEIS